MQYVLDTLPDQALLLVHALSTWWMAGVIWVVQLVHYPLMRLVSPSEWLEYEQQHRRRITLVVGPAMLLELASAVLLALRSLTHEQPRPALALGGLALVLCVWLSTALFQAPLHLKLSERFDALDHERLVRTNWVRTAAWSLRALIAGWLLAS